MATWTKIVVPRDSIRLPKLCANCMRPSPETSFILKSDRGRLKGFYLVAYRTEYLRLEVPFCAECAARQMRWDKLGRWLGWLSLIGCAALAAWLNFESWKVWLLTPFLLPAFWLMHYRDWVVRIADYDKNTITLKLKRPEYAREVARLNNVASSTSA